MAEKVLSRFADKTLFIGICTKKERVIEDGALSKPWMSQSKLCANAEQFVWKTSDWLIQEIGIAVGRAMKIILLVEEGIRRPAAIQGDLELIEFSREEPGKCATALMAMIASLNPAPEKVTHGAPSQGRTAVLRIHPRRLKNPFAIAHLTSLLCQARSSRNAH